MQVFLECTYLHPVSVCQAHRLVGKQIVLFVFFLQNNSLYEENIPWCCSAGMKCHNIKVSSYRLILCGFENAAAHSGQSVFKLFFVAVTLRNGRNASKTWLLHPVRQQPWSIYQNALDHSVPFTVEGHGFQWAKSKGIKLFYVLTI